MNDLISRQAALEMLNDNELERQADDVFDGDLHRYKRAAQRIIAQLPSAEKHGVWKKISARNYKCSCCNAWWAVDRDSTMKDFKHCPNCGARMERSEE